MNPYTRLQEILEERENQHCVDCHLNPSKYASMLHGVLICESCSNIHKKLNPEISRLKRLSESWKSTEVNYLSFGGNSKFLDFLNSYNIPLESMIPYKYNTNAVVYYRKQLISIVEGVDFDMPTPSIEEGLQVASTKQKPLGSASSRSGSMGKDIKEKAKNLFSSFQEELKVTAGKSKQKINQLIDFGIERVNTGRKASGEILVFTVEKGKEQINKGIESLGQGREFVKDKVTHGTYAVTNSEWVSGTFENGKKGIKKGFQSGKNAFIGGSEKIIEQVEGIKEGIFKGKEVIEESLESVGTILAEAAEMSKEKVGNGVEGIIKGLKRV